MKTATIPHPCALLTPVASSYVRPPSPTCRLRSCEATLSRSTPAYRLLPFVLRERRTRFALDSDVLLAGFPNRRFIRHWFHGCLVEKMWSRAKKVNQRFF